MEFIKKYSAEFLIVFLAVFLGAVAENYREQNEEQKQGREYLERFYKDLKSELPDIDKVLGANERKKARLLKLDSLHNNTPNTPEEFMAYYGKVRDASVWENPIYIPNRITIDQIKYTGAWDFIDENQADLITGYQISIDRIFYENTSITQSIDQVFNLVMNSPKKPAYYKPEDYDLVHLDKLLTNVENLYWAHLNYSRMLNRHKYFILEILNELETEHGIKPEFQQYDRMANKISIINKPDITGEDSDDIFLLQNDENPLVWSREVEIDKGEYLFRKGADWEVFWTSDLPPEQRAESGKAILTVNTTDQTQTRTHNFHLSTGKYYVEFDLSDTTYTIKLIE